GRNGGGLGERRLDSTRVSDRGEDRAGVPPGRLTNDLSLVVVLVEGVSLGEERLVDHVETDEVRTVLRRPLPADQPAAVVTLVPADPEVVYADAVRTVLVGVEREDPVEVTLVADLVLVEDRVLEDEVIRIQLTYGVRALTEGLEPLHCEGVIHEALLGR